MPRRQAGRCWRSRAREAGVVWGAPEGRFVLATDGDR